MTGSVATLGTNSGALGDVGLSKTGTSTVRKPTSKGPIGSASSLDIVVFAISVSQELNCVFQSDRSSG